MALSDYTGLVTSEYQGAAKFLATIAATAQPMVDNQALLAGMAALFDLDTTTGAQLDVVGLWVGQSRNVPAPLVGVYFCWGGTGPGWGFGAWKGPHDPSQGLTTLDDGTYRLLLRATIAGNHWDGTLAGAAAALANLFNGSSTPGTLIWIDDGLSMNMTFVVSGQQPTAVFAAILRDGLVPLRPAGVSCNYVQTSVSGAPVFCWGMNNAYGAGWGSGAWAQAL